MPTGASMVDSAAECVLIGEAMAGQSAAMEQLLFVHFSALERHVAPKIPPSVRRQLDVEDVLQDVFTQAFRDMRHFDPQAGSSLLAWLKGIADHRLADALKRIRRRKRGGDMHQLTPAAAGRSSAFGALIEVAFQESGLASREVAGEEAAQALQIAVAALSDDQREVIRARFFDGLSVEEIAIQTGRSEGAVRGLIHRAKENLRVAMGRSSRWLSR